MDELRKRQRLRKILYSRAMLALLVILIVFLVHSVYGVYDKYEASKKNENVMKQKLTDLESQKVYLASSTEELASQNGVEYELRNKFGVVRPGEKEIVIIDPVTATSDNSSVGLNPIQRFFNWIFGDW